MRIKNNALQRCTGIFICGIVLAVSGAYAARHLREIQQDAEQQDELAFAEQMLADAGQLVCQMMENIAPPAQTGRIEYERQANWVLQTIGPRAGITTPEFIRYTQQSIVPGHETFSLSLASERAEKEHMAPARQKAVREAVAKFVTIYNDHQPDQAGPGYLSCVTLVAPRAYHGYQVRSANTKLF